MGVDITDSWAGGGGPLELWELLQGGDSGNPPIQRGDLGRVPQDWEDPWRVPPEGGLTASRNSAEAEHDKQVVLPTAGCGDDGSGFGGDGDVHPPPPEYRRPVYCDSSDTGAISGGGATDGSAGDPTVVGAVRPQLWTGGREVGGTDGGVGG